MIVQVHWHCTNCINCIAEIFHSFSAKNGQFQELQFINHNKPIVILTPSEQQSHRILDHDSQTWLSRNWIMAIYILIFDWQFVTQYFPQNLSLNSYHSVESHFQSSLHDDPYYHFTLYQSFFTALSAVFGAKLNKNCISQNQNKGNRRCKAAVWCKQKQCL